MQLLFKQRLFSWFDSYDIYTEDGAVYFTVKGQPSWGHRLKVFDSIGRELGIVQERVFSLMPKFEVYATGQYLGCIRREFSLLKPKYHIDYKGWQVIGDWTAWNYTINSPSGAIIATISKELLHLTDTYRLNIVHAADALHVLLFVLAIDAEKCTKR